MPGANNNFGANNQYGTLLSSSYIAPGGGTVSRFNNFRQILANPCPAGGGERR